MDVKTLLKKILKDTEQDKREEYKISMELFNGNLNRETLENLERKVTCFSC